MNWSLMAAQCVMCYRTAAAQRGARSAVLNKGILILLIPPFLILGGVLLRAWSVGSAVKTSAKKDTNV